MTENERVARGHAAKRELTQTEAAFAAVEAAIVRELGQTPVGADSKVLKLHQSLQNLAAVKQALFDVINDGQVAEYAIAQAGLTRPY